MHIILGSQIMVSMSRYISLDIILSLALFFHEQIGNAPSNLRVVDFSHGHTGSCHDAHAFEGTAAYKHADWLFEGNEFAWVDSAYPCTTRTIPVHKEPASHIPRNAIFDLYVSHLRVRSEHTMGALKGRFQCLRGLRVPINSKSQHVAACRWVTIAIILHNLIIDVEGAASAAEFSGVHTPVEEAEDTDSQSGASNAVLLEGEEKREMLIDVLMAWRVMH